MVTVNSDINVNVNVKPSNEFSGKKIDSAFENVQHVVKRSAEGWHCTRMIDIEHISLK
jgi:hypothetical protein